MSCCIYTYKHDKQQQSIMAYLQCFNEVKCNYSRCGCHHDNKYLLRFLYNVKVFVFNKNLLIFLLLLFVISVTSGQIFPFFQETFWMFHMLTWTECQIRLD